MENQSYRASHLGPTRATSYDRAFIANPYRHMLWELEQDILGRILRLFAGREHLMHLDFACGTGRILSFMRQKGFESVGVDISADMLKVAGEKCPDAELICGDITGVDMLGNRSFDLITAFRFFPNAEGELRDSVMKRLAKHLKPGGLLVFNNHKYSGSLLYRISRTLKRGGENGMSRTEVEDLVKVGNLRVKTMYHVGIMPFTETWSPLPIPMTRIIERTAMKMPAITALSQDLVYVCSN